MLNRVFGGSGGGAGKALQLWASDALEKEPSLLVIFAIRAHLDFVKGICYISHWGVRPCAFDKCCVFACKNCLCAVPFKGEGAATSLSFPGGICTSRNSLSCDIAKPQVQMPATPQQVPPCIMQSLRELRGAPRSLCSYSIALRLTVGRIPPPRVGGRQD